MANHKPDPLRVDSHLEEKQRSITDELKNFQKAKKVPATDDEKLKEMRDMRQMVAPSSLHEKQDTKAFPDSEKQAEDEMNSLMQKPKKKGKAPKTSDETDVPDEGGSAAAFDDLKELNTFSAQEDQAIAAQLDGEAVVKEIGKSLGQAINPEVKNGDAKWSKK